MRVVGDLVALRYWRREEEDHAGVERVSQGGDANGGDTAKAEEGAWDEKPDLILWHWKDARLQSQQQVRKSATSGSSYLAEYRVPRRSSSGWATDDLRDVTPPKQGRCAFGVDGAPTS